MNKQVDMSVLPDGFLCEIGTINTRGNIKEWRLCKLNHHIESLAKRLEHRERWVRPALNHWHFNDGSMVLPVGLVCEFKTSEGLLFVEPVLCNDFVTYGDHDIRDTELIIAVKVIGVTDYYGAQLGMEVIEL